MSARRRKALSVFNTRKCRFLNQDQQHLINDVQYAKSDS